MGVTRADIQDVSGLYCAILGKLLSTAILITMWVNHKPKMAAVRLKCYSLDKCNKIH